MTPLKHKRIRAWAIVVGDGIVCPAPYEEDSIGNRFSIFRDEVSAKKVKRTYSKRNQGCFKIIPVTILIPKRGKKEV